MFKWYLDKVQDTNGNYMTIDYYKDPENGQIYLDTIEYTGNAGLSPANKVIFHLEERGDDLLSYASHSEVTTASRLKTIEIQTNFGTGYDMVRAYSLEYKQDYEPSVLESVTQYGDDATIQNGEITSGSSLPSIDMVYQETEDGYDLNVGSFDVPPYYLYNIHARGDFNGDNRTDFIYGLSDDYGRMDKVYCIWPFCIPAQWVYLEVYISREDGTFDIIPFDAPIWESRIISQGDYNDDGITDLVLAKTDKYGRISNANCHIMISNGDGTFTSIPFQLGSNYVYYKVVSTGDYNGDGHTDFITARVDGKGRLAFGIPGDYFPALYPMCQYISDGQGGFTLELISPTYDWYTRRLYVDGVPYVAGAYYTVQSSGDFNGDGKTDMLLMYSDEYWRYRVPAEPYDSLILWRSNSTTFDQVVPQLDMIVNDRVHAQGDFNGDGLTDLLIGEADERGRFQDDQSNPNDQMKVYINQGDESFVSTEIHVGHHYSCYYGCFDLPVYGIPFKLVSQGDFNGDGLSDFCFAQTNDEGKILNPTTYTYTYYATGEGLFRPGQTSLDYTGGYGPRAHGDFNGDGKSDFLLGNIDGDTGMLDPADLYIFEAKPDIPDLLTSISNNRGGAVAIEYEPSSTYKNKDGIDPDINPRIPFIVQTVSSITIRDGLYTEGQPNEYTTMFEYGDARFDHEDRDFRGFRWAKRINPDGTTIKTEFLQEEFNKGKQLFTESREYYTDNDTSPAPLLSKIDFYWEAQPVGDPAQFVYLESKESEMYEQGRLSFKTREDYTYWDYVQSGTEAHGGLHTLTTSIAGEESESITTTRLYDNFGSSGGWVWRMTGEALEGDVSGIVRKTEYGYEADTGNLLSEKFCLDPSCNTGSTITYEYDNYGNLIKETDPSGHFTEMVYDEATQTYPVEIRYPQTGEDPNFVNHIVYKQYDYKFGSVESETDENGNTTYYQYDPFGRVTGVSFPDGGQTYTEYHDTEIPNYVINRVLEGGSFIEECTFVDGLSRTVSELSIGEEYSKKIDTQTFYDEMGRVKRMVGPFFNMMSSFQYYPHYDPPDSPVVVTDYDLHGRPVEIKSSDGTYGWNSTFFDYDGLSTTITDPDGKQKTERKDYLGRLVHVIEYNNAEQYNTYYTYNAAGDLLEVRDHFNNPTTIQYDMLGRKTNMTDPDMGYWSYQYDANGNLISQTDAKYQTMTFTYDALNRLLTKSCSTSDPPVTYTYDNLSTANGRGRLASVSNTNVTTVYDEYDAMGRVVQLTKTIAGDEPRTTKYYYDCSGKVTQIGYPGDPGMANGFQTYYTYYPGSGLLESVSGSDMVEYARYSDYKPTGKIGTVVNQCGTPNITSTVYTYDWKSTRLASIVTRDSSQAEIQNKLYGYTQAGDISSITDVVDNGKLYTYDYDGLHRLIEERTDGNISATYTYNAIGNIMQKTVGTDTFTYSYHPTKIHAVSSVSKNGSGGSFNYDENGNLIYGIYFSETLRDRNIQYNADNMPTHIQINGITAVDFIYDGKGGRAKKITSSETTYYIGEHFEKINNDEIIYIFAGNIRIAKKTPTATYYFHKDHLGSSTVMTDSSGLKVETTEYLPYGHTRSHWTESGVVSDYKFTDQEFDTSTGLYDYGARMYDPVIGRFITADSLVQNPGDPQTLNRYSYCRNNPLVYVDPSGQSFFGVEFIVGAVIGAAIGGTTAAVTGGDIGMGILTGAISGGIFGGAGGIIENSITQAAASAGMSFEAAAAAGMGMSSYAQAGLHFAAGAMSGGINASLTDVV